MLIATRVNDVTNYFSLFVELRLKLSNLVPRVFSLFNVAAAREKTLAHSRSRVSNEENGGNGEKGEKNWVQDAKVKINKMAEKAEVQFKKK